MPEGIYVVRRLLPGDGEPQYEYWSDRLGWTEFDQAQVYQGDSWLRCGIPSGGSWHCCTEKPPNRSDGPYRGWVYYDFDAKKTRGLVYPTYREAADDLDARMNNVIVQKVEFDEPPWDQPCECECPGFFCSGVPGIIARVENGRLVPEASVECCGLCQRYATDETARAKLVEIGIAQRESASSPTPPAP